MHRTERQTARGPSPDVTVTWTRDTLFTDTTLSDWLKSAIRDLSGRDPVDAVNDAELLCALMQARCDTVFAAAKAKFSQQEHDSDGP